MLSEGLILKGKYLDSRTLLALRNAEQLALIIYDKVLFFNRDKLTFFLLLF